MVDVSALPVCAFYRLSGLDVLEADAQGQAHIVRQPHSPEVHGGEQARVALHGRLTHGQITQLQVRRLDPGGLQYTTRGLQDLGLAVLSGVRACGQGRGEGERGVTLIDGYACVPVRQR